MNENKKLERAYHLLLILLPIALLAVPLAEEKLSLWLIAIDLLVAAIVLVRYKRKYLTSCDTATCPDTPVHRSD